MIEFHQLWSQMHACSFTNMVKWDPSVNLFQQDQLETNACVSLINIKLDLGHGLAWTFDILESLQDIGHICWPVLFNLGSPPNYIKNAVQFEYGKSSFLGGMLTLHQYCSLILYLFKMPRMQYNQVRKEKNIYIKTGRGKLLIDGMGIWMNILHIKINHKLNLPVMD